MSRRPKAAQEFGSDSFMDVVCNVVGILIILMVLAGLRAGQAPVQLTGDAVPEVVVADDSTAASQLLPVPVDLGPPAHLQASAPQETVVEPPRELIVAADELQRDLARLAAEHETAQTLAGAARELHAEVDEQVAAARQALRERQLQWETVQHKRASTATELTKLRSTAMQLASQLEQAEAVTPNLKQIEHRITPIGRTIEGNELHFQVLNNRVAIIPLEKLIERLKEQVERRKDWLAKSQRHMGQVGPIDGFSMNYVVERDAMTVVDELRYGQGMFRISVSSWELQPERSLPSETVATAIQSGSRFYAALLEAGGGAALTFWVYPDSFAAFGELKRFCHAQNFLVAGRPLPAGQPISGSPSGSRSAGQ